MEGSAGKPRDASGAVLATADAEAAERIAGEIRKLGRTGQVATARSLAELQRLWPGQNPEAILLDDRLLRGLPLTQALAPFETRFPVILLASLDRQAEAAPLLASNAIEYVARSGQFHGVAAGLLERQLRARTDARDADIGEIFRHEINNPLTGILGNAELVLAHREHFGSLETQRLETVVDLAVRLRETIRRLSNVIEQQSHSLTA